MQPVVQGTWVDTKLFGSLGYTEAILTGACKSLTNHVLKSRVISGAFA